MKHTHYHKKASSTIPLRKIADIAMIGSLSALVLAALSGCNNEQHDATSNQQAQGGIKQGAFVIVEEQANGSYKVLEEYPSATTRVVVRDREGKERILSDEEVDTLIKQEAARVDNGTSPLLSPNGGEQGGGLGLGGAILASAAGALLGSYIGNKLFNNPNYQQNKQRNYKSPQAYERSANNFRQNASTARTGATPSNAKGGFYQSNTARGAATSTGGYGG